MLDLKAVFVQNALALNPLLETPTVFASQTASSSSYSSFSETLTSLQDDSAQSQNETLDSAATVQQFRNGNSAWTATSAGQLDNWGASTSSSSDAQTSPSQETVQVKPREPSAQPKEDTYEESGVKDHHEADVLHPEQSAPEDSGVQAIFDKSTEKPKHHKATDLTPRAAGSSESARPNVTLPGDETPSVTLQGSVDSSTSGSNATISQSDGNVPTNTPKATGLRASETNTNLAFALKIQGADSSQTTNSLVDGLVPVDTGATQPDLSGQTSASAFAVQLSAMIGAAAVQKGPASPNSLEQNSELGVATVPAPVSESSLVSPGTSADPSAEDVSKVTEIPEEQSSTNQSVKAVQVQITGSDNQKVDLRFMEKSGALTVSVRSADGSLTKALQQNLSDLNNRFSEQQIRAEWWKPDIQKPDLPQKATNSSNSDNNNSATQDQGSQNRGNSGQQGGRGARQPDWAEELSDLRKSTQNGTQYSWHL